jgi:hypothetical protein
VPANSIYGTGLAGDSKSNRTIQPNHGTGSKASIRWRATQTSRLNAVVLQWRTGTGYSAGDLGQYRISVFASGSNGFPTGQSLGSFTYRPNVSNGSFIRRHEFASPPSIVAGNVYHLVIENIHSNPGSNYSAINCLYTFQSYSPRQPIFPDTFAWINKLDTSNPSVDGRHTPNVDLEYANGGHDGQAYLNNRRNNYNLIGGSRMLRERFTVSGGDRVVDSVWVRVNRQSGSAPLVLRLERGDGTVIEQHQVPGSERVNTWSLGADSDTGDWVGITLDQPRRLSNGETYSLRLSAPSGTQYAMVNLLARDSTHVNGEFMKSYHFSDGRTEKSDDSGSSWSLADQAWAAFSNMQFYFTTQ